MFFLLVLPKAGYVPGLVINPRKKIRVWDFIKGFEHSQIKGEPVKKTTLYDLGARGFEKFLFKRKKSSDPNI